MKPITLKFEKIPGSSVSEKTYREFLEVEARPYAEFRERIMRHVRRRLLHRRPAKWWRHPKAWQNRFKSCRFANARRRVSRFFQKELRRYRKHGKA